MSEDPEVRWGRSRGSGGAGRWLKIAGIILAVLLLTGAAVTLIGGRSIAFDAVRRLTARKFPDVKWISREEFARWREDSAQVQPIVLDTRTQAEYELSHLKGAVRTDPYRPSLRPLREVPKDAPIVVYCSVGYRSARVAHWLARQGFTNVANLEGSLFQWANDGRPTFREGRPTLLVHPYDARWGLLLESRYRAEAALGEHEKRSRAP